MGVPNKGVIAVNGEKRGKSSERQKHLTFQQYRAIILLFSGFSEKQTRIKLGIHPHTLSKWWRCKAFRALYEERAQDLLNSAIADAKRMLKETLAFLKQKMRCKQTKDADRIRAAGMLIQSAFKAQEVTEITDALIAMQEFKAELEAAKRSGGFFHDAGTGEPDAGKSEVELGGAPAANGQSHH
jgi:transposase-like protein